MTIETPTATLMMPLTAVSSDLVGLVERVNPAVVQVRGRRRGVGSGITWRDDGFVLTNHHVVAAQPGGLQILMADDRVFAARVVASNPGLDLALLRIDARDLPVPPVGDSARLRVGELVFAIGNPWGQRGAVTAGIVSGLGDLTAPGGERVPYIRTDARLMPGNSGGPLLNARGEVVGVNAMVFGGDLGVSIPSRVASDWVAAVVGQRVRLGLQVQPVDLPAPAAGQPRGLLVAAVEPDSPAQLAGVMVGDVLLTLAGETLPDGGRLLALLGQLRPGADVALTVWRAGAVQTLRLTTGARQGWA